MGLLGFSIPMQSMLCTWNVDRRSLDCNKADVSIDVPVSSVVIVVVMVCRRFGTLTCYATSKVIGLLPQSDAWLGFYLLIV